MKQVRFSSVVNPNGYPTTVQFFVGTDVDNLSPIGDPIELPASQESSTVTLETELEAETDYVTKGTAENEAGFVESGLTEFRTPDESGAPTITDVTVEFI